MNKVRKESYNTIMNYLKKNPNLYFTIPRLHETLQINKKIISHWFKDNQTNKNLNIIKKSGITLIKYNNSNNDYELTYQLDYNNALKLLHNKKNNWINLFELKALKSNVVRLNKELRQNHQIKYKTMESKIFFKWIGD